MGCQRASGDRRAGCRPTGRVPARRASLVGVRGNVEVALAGELAKLEHDRRPVAGDRATSAGRGPRSPTGQQEAGAGRPDRGSTAAGARASRRLLVHDLAWTRHLWPVGKRPFTDAGVMPSADPRQAVVCLAVSKARRRRHGSRPRHWRAIGCAWHAPGKSSTWNIRTWIGFAVVVIGVVIALVQLDLQRRQPPGSTRSSRRGRAHKQRDALISGQLRELEQRALTFERQQAEEIDTRHRRLPSGSPAPIRPPRAKSTRLRSQTTRTGRSGMPPAGSSQSQAIPCRPRTKLACTPLSRSPPPGPSPPADFLNWQRKRISR